MSHDINTFWWPLVCWQKGESHQTSLCPTQRQRKGKKTNTTSGCPCSIFLRGHVHICLIYLLVFFFPPSLSLPHNTYGSPGCIQNIQKLYLMYWSKTLCIHIVQGHAKEIKPKIFHDRKTTSPWAQRRGRPPCISHSSLVVWTALGSSLYLLLGSEKCPFVGGWAGHGWCWEKKGGWRHLCWDGMQLMGLQRCGPQREEQTLTSWSPIYHCRQLCWTIITLPPIPLPLSHPPARRREEGEGSDEERDGERCTVVRGCKQSRESVREKENKGKRYKETRVWALGKYLLIRRMKNMDRNET